MSGFSERMWATPSCTRPSNDYKHVIGLFPSFCSSFPSVTQSEWASCLLHPFNIPPIIHWFLHLHSDRGYINPSLGRISLHGPVLSLSLSVLTVMADIPHGSRVSSWRLSHYQPLWVSEYRKFQLVWVLDPWVCLGLCSLSPYHDTSSILMNFQQ